MIQKIGRAFEEKKFQKTWLYEDKIVNIVNLPDNQTGMICKHPLAKHIHQILEYSNKCSRV